MWGLSTFGSNFPKNAQYLENGKSNQKSVTNKKDGQFNLLSGVCHQILCIFNHYGFITISKKYNKKLDIS